MEQIFYIENQNYAQNVAFMSSDTWIVVDEYSC
jgi:hypothetical protein